ncbi:cytochrome b [Herminiimonas aquatilis]|uniref:Cytochrome b n=1 Tax=Herminiimonas aquatilis TaxID=345342 RepID=A0ABW2J380_9BURK
MRWKNTTTGYGYVTISLHWLSVILVVVTYAIMNLKFLAARGSILRSNMADWHYAAGLTLFFLTWLRLLLRGFGDTTTITPPPTPLQRLLAKVVKIALYGILLGLPLLGWLTLNANGNQINYFGLSLPMLIGKNLAWARDLKELHEGLATIGYVLIALHTLAALFHYYIQQDNTVQMMWFRRKKS